MLKNMSNNIISIQKKSYTASSIYFSYIAPGTHDLKLEAAEGDC